MKIGMLTTWQTKCGIAAYTEALVGELRELPGIDVEVVPIRPGIMPPQHYASQAETLNHCDLVHIQHEYSFWGGYIPGKNRFHTLRRAIRKPVVLTAHTTDRVDRMLVPPEDVPGSPLKSRLKTAYRKARFQAVAPLLLRNRQYRRWIEQSHFASANQLIVHTQEARDELIERGISPERMNVLAAGVPRPLSSQGGGSDFRASHRLAGRRLLTLFGYVAPFKGYELALEILPALPNDVYLVIAGGVRTSLEEPYVAALQRRIADLGLSGRVTITGYLSDEEIAGVMEATDIVIVPHTRATGSYSVVFALAYAKPIVASDLACFQEIKARLPALRLHAAGDPDSLLTNLCELLDDPAEQAAISKEAGKYAIENSWRKVAERTVDVYRRACEVIAQR